LNRIEIIANRSIQEDMFDAFKKADVVKHYTLFPGVLGVGKSGPRMGDHIWPEENFNLVLYCDSEEADNVKRIVKELKERFSHEGIKLFEILFEN